MPEMSQPNDYWPKGFTDTGRELRPDTPAEAIDSMNLSIAKLADAFKKFGEAADSMGRLLQDAKERGDFDDAILAPECQRILDDADGDMSDDVLLSSIVEDRSD